MAKYLSIMLMVCASFVLLVDLGRATGACGVAGDSECMAPEPQHVSTPACAEDATCPEPVPASLLTAPQGVALPPLTEEDLRIAMPLVRVDGPASF